MSLVVFRADAGPAIGSGHVMRALALASVFRNGGWSIGFAATEETFQAVAALRAAPFEYLTLPPEPEMEAQALRRCWPGGADVLVVDHYGRDAALEQACRGWAKRIVVIDDLADRPHDADVLVDVATPGAAYRGLVPEHCKILSGPEYAIVHPAFRGIRETALARRDGRRVARVLVSFGQMDTANATCRALDALRATGFTGCIDVVLGGVAPHLATVQDTAAARRADAGSASAQAQVEVHVDAQDMPRLMTEADLAVGAGGVTALERCCLGLPSVLVTLADNQREIVTLLTNTGAAVDAGETDAGLVDRLGGMLEALVNDGSQRAAMACAAARLVDGRGAHRILLAAVGACIAKNGHAVDLRLAGPKDEAWLLELHTKPETRRYANEPSPPGQDMHHQWLTQALANPTRLLMIAEVDGIPVGMLRLDRVKDGERINIAVDPDYHRQGIGAAMLASAARLRPGQVLDAEVLPQNKASQTLFARAGYRQIGERLFRRGPR